MIEARGFGRRIRQTIWDIQSQIGRKYTQADFARDVGMVQRGEPWSDKAVSAWISEANQPDLATFMAMAVVAGHRSAGWLAFNDEQAKGGGLSLPAQRATQPDPAILIPATDEEALRREPKAQPGKRTRRARGA